MTDQTPIDSSSPASSLPTETHIIRPETVKPRITFFILGLTCLFFVSQFVIEMYLGVDLLFYYLGKINSAILMGQVWRLITPVLLHSSIWHIGFNMYALYVIGSRIESIYGHWRFLALYILSGFGGNVLSFALTKENSLGASTAIFGLLAAEIVFIIQNRKIIGSQSQSMLKNMGIILLINLFLGLNPSSNIDNFGHLGGFLAGLVFAFFCGPLWKISRTSFAFELKDTRKKSDILAAVVLVFFGFGIIAIMPFLLQ